MAVTSFNNSSQNHARARDSLRLRDVGINAFVHSIRKNGYKHMEVA